MSATPTGYFGALTKAGVVAWQKSASLPSTGFFGPMSRAAFASGSTGTTGTTATTGTTGKTGTTGTTGTTVTTTTGVAGALTVTMPGDQPAPNLAPGSAARVPFTKVTFTASNAGDVTVKGVTVERQGLANDAVFIGVVLLDENGTQVGLAKTLNSIHQAVLNEPFVVKAGTSRVFTLAGNMDTPTNLGSYAGQVAKLAVVAVDGGTSSVGGALPIVGNGMTINSTLTIGSVTIQRGSTDTRSLFSKPVGSI